MILMEGVEKEKTRSQWREIVYRAFVQITGRGVPDYDEEFYFRQTYLSGWFEDSSKRRVDFRLYEVGKGEFMLFENMGNPLALLELRNRFESLGVPIKRFGVQPESLTPEVKKALGL